MRCTRRKLRVSVPSRSPAFDRSRDATQKDAQHLTTGALRLGCRARTRHVEARPRAEDQFRNRACCDPDDCPWTWRRLQSCIHLAWFCHTSDPTGSDTPSRLYSPTPCPVRPLAQQRRTDYAFELTGGASTSATPVTAQPRPRRPNCSSLRSSRSRCRPCLGHSSSPTPPLGLPPWSRPCRSHRAHCTHPVHRGAKSYRPCR